MTGFSKEIRLLHDSQEFFLVRFADAIAVSFINHLLKFSIGHTFTKLFGNMLQVLEGGLTSLAVIKATAAALVRVLPGLGEA